MDKEEIIKDKFEKWFNEIKDQLIQIIICQNIDKHMRTIFKNNPKLHKGGNFWNWLDQNYVYSIVIQVARLVESGKYSDDRSFHKFLSDLKKDDNYKSIISEDIYFNMFDPIHVKHLGENRIRSDFRNITNNLSIDKLLESDMKTLNILFEKFKKLRHKKIAHLTDTELTVDELSTYDDINESIEELKKLVNKSCWAGFNPPINKVC